MANCLCLAHSNICSSAAAGDLLIVGKFDFISFAVLLKIGFSHQQVVTLPKLACSIISGATFARIVYRVFELYWNAK